MKIKVIGGIEKKRTISENRRRALLWRSKGWNNTRIAKKLGISRTMVDFIFNRKPRYTDKKAWAKYHREYRRKNIKKIRSYKREYNKIYRKKYGYENEQNSKERYPGKEKARRALEYAVKKGRIKKLPCEVCGNFNSEAHHENYRKPLEVNWLCRRHHLQMEGRLII